ncbi:MAG: pyruvate kinase [Betaproteobacteria bacterium]
MTVAKREDGNEKGPTHEMCRLECHAGGVPTGLLELQGVLAELTAIHAEVIAAAAAPRASRDSVHPDFRESAANLLHYLALRRRDLRPLQLRLAALGLSSLGRAESHVLATLDAVLDVLRKLVPDTPVPAQAPARVDFARGQRLLAEHTRSLLGPEVPGRAVRIMVTMPAEAADDGALIHGLMQQGMDCMRINCAHDDAAAWSKMIGHLRQAEKALARSCKIVMDLAGPKLRTGPLEPGPAVVKIRPRRDAQGRVTAAARVWLAAASRPQPSPTSADASLGVADAWLACLRNGDTLRLTDARGAARTLVVAEVTAHGCWLDCARTTYLVPGTILQREGDDVAPDEGDAVIGELPAREGFLTLQQQDLLVLTRDLEPGRPATYDAAGQVATPAVIGCTIPAVFDDVRAGESIWFDDGRIGGVVESVEGGRMHVRITHTRPGGARLKADKGINLPDSVLRLGALTAKDLDDLAFVAQHADVVELSFANSAGDVEQLQQHLARLTQHPPAIVLKIETQRGFENLPDMLLTAMRSPCCGVMIARGDLAVECGFERLAEVQEEILWICEAAHVPVIWATQVLESLAKEGMASRAEITDAAMGHRAECVMLNKGPHVLSAVRVLDDILRRMQAHQTKKLAMLRELHLAHALTTEPGVAAGHAGPLGQVGGQHA